MLGPEVARMSGTVVPRRDEDLHAVGARQGHLGESQDAVGDVPYRQQSSDSGALDAAPVHFLAP
jgi:hypothetical protein